MIEKGLSQQKFADIIGVNQITVSQWLIGHKKPTYDTASVTALPFSKNVI